MNYCPKCGNKVEGNLTYCPYCGSKLETGNTTIVNNYYSNSTMPRIEERSIVMIIILSLITCGIYGLYWIVKVTDEAKILSNKDTPSGALTLLLSIITCGIYMIYWNYQMGKNMYEAGQKYGINIEDNSIIYLVLSLIGLGIVSECLMQNDLNKFANVR